MNDQAHPQPPMLFDVVIPGDYLKPAGIWLPRGESGPAENDQPLGRQSEPENIEERIDRAIDEVLPEVTEEVTRTARQLLQQRLREKLRRPADDTARGPQEG